MITEKNIKKWISIIPLLAVVLTSFFLTKLFIIEIESHYKSDISQLVIDEEQRIKAIAKSRIENAHKLLQREYELVLQEHKQEIKKTVQLGYDLIEQIYLENKNLPKQKIYKIINEKLNKYRFFSDFSGFYFVYTLDGKNILSPHLPIKNGLNFFEMKSSIAKEFITKTTNLIKEKKEGFENWRCYREYKVLEENKTGYIKEFKPLNIFVGSAKFDGDIKESSKKKLAQLLNLITYDNKGYVFAYDKKGNTIAHVKKSLIGKNRWKLVHNGRFLVQEIIMKSSAKKEGAYLRYLATYDPNTKLPADKISFIKKFEPLDWSIGTGLYTTKLLKDIEDKRKTLQDDLDSTIINVICLSMLITSLIILVLFILLNRLNMIFTRYKDNLNEANKTLELKVKKRTKELEKSKNKLKKLALQDSLTGLYNRRYFEKIIEKLITISNRSNEDLSLVIIDIDNFKSINDTYGHDTGDLVLKKLSSTLTDMLRQSDVISRIGGEEFALVLPNTKLENAYILCEKLRVKVEKINLGLDKSNPLKFTISSGIASYNKEIDQSYYSIFKRADEALYKAKNSGKNKVVLQKEI